MTVFSLLTEELSKMKFPSSLTVAPPNIYQWLCQLLHRTSSSPFPYLPGVSEKTKNVIAVTIQIHWFLLRNIDNLLICQCHILFNISSTEEL